MQANIFGPLGMKNSGMDENQALLSKRAEGYNRAGSKLSNASFIDMTVPFSAGALYSTVEDLYLWDQALLGEKLLPAKWRDLMFTNYIKNGPGNYGYGWGVRQLKIPGNAQRRLLVEHSGGINGFVTFISRMPEDKNLVVALSNVGGSAPSELSSGIRSILYGMPYDMPKKSIAIALDEEIRNKGLAGLPAKFREMKGSEQYIINEGEINQLGYDFLAENKFKEAIEVCKINVEEFPNSGNCYDSLGEAYLKNGDK